MSLQGGGSSLSKKEREKIHEEVDAEFDAGDERVAKRSKGVKPKKRNTSDVDELGSLFDGGLTGKRPRYANKITTKNISAGMKLLGVVTEVNQKDIVVSLPGGLRGLVRASEALDFTDFGTEDDENELLRDIFSVGQLVPCIVLQLDDDKKEAGKRKIWLSLRLSLLHKGFSLDSFQPGMVCGGSSLSKKEREKIHEEVDAEFDAGDERVAKRSKGGKPKKRNTSDVDELGSLFDGGLTGKRPRYANKITIKNISAGMKLLGVVTEVNQKDIVVSLPGGLRGLVRASEALDFTDFGTEDDENELLRDIFSVGQLVPCIVLQLDDDKKEAGKRKIWLSLRLSLLHKGFSLDSFQPGMASSSKKGDINNSAADLPERTETKAPEVVVDREEKESAETKQWITNETRGLDTEVNDVIGEGNREREKNQLKPKKPR
ncbi:hypothetical protein F2Q70_00037469 [Brassica cretica]|uniref:S1 motif domain-containing protein n=1 Tax=Brassica cretica TaxID=69181 RepID=A0A8S9JRE4_BRACR|nr:hypothetical protein F2Q70_00037469 [Brassica cretica]